jgi:uncharacterized delta-60 repeat protein
MHLRFRQLAVAFVFALLAPTDGFGAPGDLDTQFGGFGNGGHIQLTFFPQALAIDAQGRLVLVGKLGGHPYIQRRSGPKFRDVEEATFKYLDNEYDSEATAVAIAPDGKIAVAGYSAAGNDVEYAVALLNPDLLLDTTFAGDGTTVFELSSFNSGGRASAVLVSDDNQIVVAGSTGIAYSPTGSDFSVARLNADGTLDSTFSDDGRAIFAVTDGTDKVLALAFDAAGRILLAGNANDNFGVMRINDDGTPDGDFDDDGFVSVDFDDGREWAYGVAVGADGKIALAGGHASDPSTMKVARLLDDGTLDDSFDGDGRATTSVDGEAAAFNVAIQPDGKIIAGGVNHFDGDPDNFMLVRYGLSGFPDPTFGDNGIVLTSFGNEASIEAMALQTDGWIVAAGFGGHLVRYRSDGSLDAGGIVQVVFDPVQVEGFASAVALDSQKRLVVAGHVKIGLDNYDPAVARFRTDAPGTLDHSFGNGDPKLGTSVYGSPLEEQISGMTVFLDKTIVVGQIGTSPNLDFYIGRFKSDGTPDEGCALFGYNVRDFGHGDDSARAVAVGVGSTFVAGTVNGPIDADYGVVPFNSDCTENTGYGVQRVDFGAGDTLGGQVLQIPKFADFPNPEKEVLAGSMNGDIALTRVAAEPLLPGFGAHEIDTGFGTGGKTVVQTGGTENVTAFGRQSDGTLIVAGTNATIDNADFFVARFTAAGFLDTTFGTGGFAYADFGLDDRAYAIAIRKDNSIAVAGCTNGSRFAVAQFTASGQLDSGFAGDGTATVEVGSDADECARAVRFIGPKRIVLAGFSSGGGRPNFALAELETTVDPLATTTTTEPPATTTTTPPPTTTLPPTTTTTTTTTSTTTTVPSGTCADANDDGSVTATDALIVLRVSVGSTSCLACVCDVDDSGGTTASDALRVLRAAVGQNVTLNCPPCG